MKYIKKFENVEEPEIGDYVLMRLRPQSNYSPRYEEFIKNNIGEIVSKDVRSNKITFFEVRYHADTLRGLGFASKEESGKSISDRFRALGEVKQLDYVEKLISNQQKMCRFKWGNCAK